MADMAVPYQFLEDRPAHEDFFKVHTAYAAALLEVIERSQPPFTIGLFGSWGTGKTTVVEQLRRLLSERKDLAFVSLDVWKFSRDPVKRWILTEMEKQLGLQNLQYGDPPRDLHSHLRLEEVETQTHPVFVMPSLKSGLWATLLGLLTVIAVGALILALWAAGPVSAALAWVGGAAGILAVVGTAGWKMLELLGKIAVQQRSTQIHRLPAVAPEHFGAIFREMVKKVVAGAADKKIVIAFDNLDRCEEDAAVEVLSTIKTYLDVAPCVYIVPCDEKGLTRHILRSYGTSEDDSSDRAELSREFLRKFFQLTIRLPEIGSFDYEAFVDQQVEAAGATELLNETARDVALIAYGQHTPRKLKRFVNDFLGYYTVASVLERSGLLEPGAVTGNPAFLAKMVVIYQEWPEFIERVKKNPEFISEVTEAFRRGDSPKEFVDPEDVERFLRATQGIDTPVDILPFVYLKRPKYEEDPRLVEQVNEILRGSDRASFERLIEADAGRADHMWRIAIERLSYWQRTGRQLQSMNAARVLVGIHTAAPASAKADLLKALWTVLVEAARGDAGEQLVRNFESGEVLRIAQRFEAWQRRVLLDSYLARLAPGVAHQDFHDDLLKNLIAASELLSQEQKAICAEHIAGRLAQEEEITLQMLEQHGTELVNANMVEPVVPSRIASALSFEPDELNRLRLRAYLRLRDISPSEASDAIVSKIIEVVSPSRTTSLDETSQFAVDAVILLGREAFSPSSASELWGALAEQARNPTFSAKGQWVNAGLSVWDIGGADSAKEQIAEAAGVPMKTGNADSIEQFLGQLTAENQTKLFASPHVARALREQADAFSSLYGRAAQENRRRVLRLVPWPAMKSLLPEIVDAQFPWDVALAAELAVESHRASQLTDAEFEGMVHRLLEDVVRGALAQHLEVVSTVAAHLGQYPSRSWTGEFLELVAGLGIEILRFDRPSGRDVLLALQPVLPEDRARTLADRLIGDLMSLDAGGHALTDCTPYFDVLASYEGPLASPAHDTLNALASRTLAPGKPDPVIELGLALMKRIPQLRLRAAVKRDLQRLKDDPQFAASAEALLTRTLSARPKGRS